MDRRTFLAQAGMTAAALTLPNVLNAQPASRHPRSETAIWLDAQGSPGIDKAPDGKYRASPAWLEAIDRRQIDSICFSVGDVGNGPNRFKTAVEHIAIFDAVIASHSDKLLKVNRASDFLEARKNGRCSLTYNFQDITALEGDLDKVEVFKALGVKTIQLTYNKRNLAGDGCLEASNAGLSDFGRQVIAKINEQRVLLDLSHASQRTIAEGIAASKAPPAITHSGCLALANNPRNVGDTEMRALAEKGGVFGLYLMPFLRTAGQPQREDLIRHIEHALNICGEDHIGIGTDNPIMGHVINAETREAHRKWFEDRRSKGIAAPGEAPDIFYYVEGYNGVDRFERIADDLRARGWSAARIDKLLGGNFVRLYHDVWEA